MSALETTATEQVDATFATLIEFVALYQEASGSHKDLMREQVQSTAVELARNISIAEKLEALS